MDRRGSIIGGLILIFLGGAFLLRMLYPALFDIFSWPFIIIGIGLAFLISAIFSRVSPLAIPGCIITGIGGIFYVQYIQNDYSSWAYIWTLIPGFVGIGILLSGLLSGEHRIDPSVFFLLIISLSGFIIFGSFFLVGANFIKFWPVLLILTGLFILIGPIMRFRH